MSAPDGTHTGPAFLVPNLADAVVVTESRDAARALAPGCPVVADGGSVEVHAVLSSA